MKLDADIEKRLTLRSARRIAMLMMIRTAFRPNPNLRVRIPLDLYVCETIVLNRLRKRQAKENEA